MRPRIIVLQFREARPLRLVYKRLHANWKIIPAHTSIEDHHICTSIL